MTTYEFRIYKNEYTEKQIAYISKHFKVLNETEKVLCIEAIESEIKKIQSVMFTSDEQFKAVFPEYMTAEERKAYTAKTIEELKFHIAHTLIDIINNGDTDSVDFRTLRNFYLHDLNNID